MDSQAPRKNGGNEHNPTTKTTQSYFTKICFRLALHRIRQTLTRTEQSENERLYVRDRHDLRTKQKIDDALRTTHVRLPCCRVRNADRCTGKDSRPHQYEHDPSLREILRTAYRTGNAEDRRGVRRSKLNNGNRIRNRASELLTALMPGCYIRIIPF